MMVDDRKTEENLEESIQCLNIESNQVGQDQSTDVGPYPDRPDEPNCSYFMKTGQCGYGSRCRYNHPAPLGKGMHYEGKLPSKAGQPECQFFLKTGTCKYGASCKYHHPRDKLMPLQIPLNRLGLPMRQEEKPCPFYMRNGCCKFGFACKFHHPEPASRTVVPEETSSAYGYSGSAETAQPVLPFLGGMPSWMPLQQSLYLTAQNSPGFPPSFVPMIFSPSHNMMTGQQPWGVYVDGTNFPDSHWPEHHLEDLKSPSHAVLPERPDQPECQYFLKTGRCRYGSACKYHHPRDRTNNFSIGPHMLPLRPGQTVCAFYASYGSCKYGSACKFDHPYMWTGYSGGHPAYPALSSWDASSSSSLFPSEGNPMVEVTFSSTAAPETYNEKIKIDQDPPAEQPQTPLGSISPPPLNHSD